MLNPNEQGRTMLEMMGVLAIMGIIVYGAIAGINYGMVSYKITQAYNDIQDIAQGVEDLYSWSSTYPNDMMEALCKNDIFPDGCDTHNAAMGQFGGNITVSPYAGGTNFEISYILGQDNEEANTTYVRLASMEWCKNGLAHKLEGSAIRVHPAQKGDTGYTTCE